MDEPPADDAFDQDARERLDRFLDTLVRLGIDGLRLTALPDRDDPVLEAARIAAERRARDVDLTDLVAEARRTAQDVVWHAFGADNYHPTIIGLNWGLSDGPTADRVATGIAAADAATASVLEPFLSKDDLSTLRARFDLIDPGRSDPVSDGTPDAPDRQADTVAEVAVIVAVAACLTVAMFSGWWVLVVAAALPVVVYRRRRAAERREAESPAET